MADTKGSTATPSKTVSTNIPSEYIFTSSSHTKNRPHPLPFVLLKWLHTHTELGLQNQSSECLSECPGTHQHISLSTQIAKPAIPLPLSHFTAPSDANVDSFFPVSDTLQLSSSLLYHTKYIHITLHFATTFPYCSVFFSFYVFIDDEVD